MEKPLLLQGKIPKLQQLFGKNWLQYGWACCQSRVGRRTTLNLCTMPQNKWKVRLAIPQDQIPRCQKQWEMRNCGSTRSSNQCILVIGATLTRTCSCVLISFPFLGQAASTTTTTARDCRLFLRHDCCVQWLLVHTFVIVSWFEEIGGEPGQIPDHVQTEEHNGQKSKI